MGGGGGVNNRFSKGRSLLYCAISSVRDLIHLLHRTLPPSLAPIPASLSPPHSFHFFNLQSKIYFCNLIDCFKHLRRHQVNSSINNLSDRLCFSTIGYTVTVHQKSPTADILHTHTHTHTLDALNSCLCFYLSKSLLFLLGFRVTRGCDWTVTRLVWSNDITEISQSCYFPLFPGNTSFSCNPPD